MKTKMTREGLRPALQDMILSTVDELAADFSKQERGEIDLTKGDDLPLFGDDGFLDSLALVSLVVAVEQKISERFDIGVSLADEKAMSQARTPFKTVGTFSKYIEDVIITSQG